MPLAARRLLLRSNTFNNRFLYRSSRTAPRCVVTSQWHRQLSFSPRRLADNKEGKPSKAQISSKGQEGVKSAQHEDHTETVITENDGSEIRIVEAEPGFVHDTWAKSADDGGSASLEDFQDQFKVSDAEMVRLMSKYPGIDLQIIESLKLGKIKESDLQSILQQKYPDGPPETEFSRRNIKDLDQLEEYAELLTKLESGMVTEEEGKRLAVLQEKVSRDPEVMAAITEAVEEPETNELFAAPQSEVDAARKEMGVEDAVQEGTTAADSPFATPPALDEEDVARLSPEDAEVLKEMQADPEAWEMIQMDSMVEFAESIVSGQFDEQYLQSLDQEELEELGSLQQDQDFVESMKRLPRDLKAAMAAKPEVVERAKKLGEKVGFGKRRLLSMPDVDMDRLVDDEGDEDDDEMDDDEIEDELENMSVEELESILANARQDPEFSAIEQKMEKEMFNMFGDKFPGLGNLRRRMLIKTARAWKQAKIAGVSPQRRIEPPVRAAYLQGIQEALDQEMDLYEKLPLLLPAYMAGLKDVKEEMKETRAEDSEFDRKMDNLSRKLDTKDQGQLEAFFRDLDEEEHLGVDGDPNYPREREAPGFFNYGEDVGDELGEDEDFDMDDLTHQGHNELELQRELREYARWAAWELPLLHKLAPKEPYQFPEMQKTPLRFRYTSYLGEHHPAAKKVVVEFSPANLPLTPAQRTTLTKLVGPRYHPSADIIKMSSDRFETAAQNKRYLGDLVDKLIKAAREKENEFADLPLDTRFHRRKEKVFHEFPEEWKMTPVRREALDSERQKLAQGQEKRLLEGSVVDGLGVINKALRGSREEPVPVIVGRESRQKLL